MLLRLQLHTVRDVKETLEAGINEAKCRLWLNAINRQDFDPTPDYGWPNVSKLAILKAGRLQAESSQFQAGSSRFQAGSSRFQAGSSRFQSGSSRFEARSSQFEAGSRSTRLSNVRIESIPNRIIECSNRVDFWIRFLAQIDSMLSLGTRYNKVYTPLSPP